MSRVNKLKKIELLRKKVILFECSKNLITYLYKYVIRFCRIYSYSDKNKLINILIYLFKLQYLLSTIVVKLSKYKRFCILSMHNRSLRYFKYSRMSLKEQIQRGNILGFYKASW